MKKKLILALICIFSCSVLAFTACKNNGDTSEKDTAPEITILGNVPATGAVGIEVTLPAAKATDKKDGDVSDKLKLTVALLKADGTVQKELLYEVSGSKEQKFTPAVSSVSQNYKITYSVKNSVGLKADKLFDFAASPDTDKPTLSLNTSSVEGFSVAEGITGKAVENIILPSATAIDNPGNRNISTDTIIYIYEKVNGVKNQNVFTYFTDTSSVKTVRLPKGEYIAVYTVKDGANNAADDVIEFNISVAEADVKNLVKEPSNFAYEGRDGMSWYNEYGELCFGHMPSREPLDQTVGFSLATTKIYDQIVGINFTADIPENNGEMFYTVSARGSKNRTTMPNAETCAWPDYLFLRIGKSKIESRSERACDKEMTAAKEYNEALADGKQHTLYVQWLSAGTSADAADAKIWIYGWVDKIPTSYDLSYVSFAFYVVSGDSNGLGTLANDTFKEMWGQTSAGWLSMDCYCPVKEGFDNDHMRINGMAVYGNGTTSFNCDIKAPDVDVSFNTDKVFAINDKITLPEATVDGETEKGLKVIFGKSETVVTNGEYTPTAVGDYTILYWATDNAGNFGYKKFVIKVAQKDTEAPVLTISDKSAVTVALGDEIKIPSATAEDNVDGNLSASITVEYIGKEYDGDLKPGDSLYPMTVGAHRLKYTVADSFNNVSSDYVDITVTGGTTGDLTEGNALTVTGGNGYRSKEYIYDQKVSMILSVPKTGSIVGFNVRGPIGSNGDWPSGMVIRMLGDGTIQVSAQGHDSAIFGTTSYSNAKYWFNTNSEILFEYKISNVKINDVEYIKVQIWIQGDELTFGVYGTEGQIELEEGSKAIYEKIENFSGERKLNVYSSPFWITCPGGTAVVSKLRIDGTSCEKPAGPTIPQGLKLPSFSTGDKSLITSTVALRSNDNDATIGKYSNEDYMAITFKANEVNSKGAILFNVTGAVNGWSGGVIFRITTDGIELRCVYANGDGDTVLRFSKAIYAGGINTDEYTLIYKLTYNTDKDVVTSISIDAWIQKSGETAEKLIPTQQTNSKITWNEAGTVTMNYSLFTQTDIECGDIKAWILEALNGTTTWTVTKVEKLSQAPAVV